MRKKKSLLLTSTVSEPNDSVNVERFLIKMRRGILMLRQNGIKLIKMQHNLFQFSMIMIQIKLR